MGTTITIRTDEALRSALEKKARAQGKTVSQLARDILRGAVEDRPLELRTGHLRGRLNLGRERTDAWREDLRRRNWRP